MLIAAVLCLVRMPAWAAQSYPSSEAEWTVMVFMNAKNDLECFGLQNFAQMATIGSNDKVNMLVEFGRPKNHQNCANSPELWSGVRRYRVVAGIKATDQASIQAFRRVDGSTADMGSEKTLSEFLRWSMKLYPAKHYMLVIWNHGQGFRLLLARNNSGGVATSTVSSATLTDTQPTITGGVRSVSFDDDSGNHLFNSDITQALQENITEPIDVLGFDACLMSMLETGYQMKAVAHHMIASEELVPGSGWNYTALLRSLEGSDPSIDSIAKQLESTYQKENEEQHATLSMINLDTIDELAKAVSVWSNALAGALENGSSRVRERDALSKSRSDCKPYGKWYNVKDPALQTSVDLHRLAALDAANSSDPGVQSAAKQIVSLIEGRTIVASRYASTISNDDSGYGSWGLAIYFPSTLKDFKADSHNSPGYLVGNTDHPVSFVDKEQWASLLQTYYKNQAAQ
jgi:Clostripain family